MSQDQIIINEVLMLPEAGVIDGEINLWIGISFGNNWFSRENIERLIRFGLNHTKESLLILIPGRLQVSNLRYIDNLSRAQSLKKAFEMEDEMKMEITEIIATFSNEDRKRVVVANYDDALTHRAVKQREELMREFSKQKIFYDLVMEISKEMLKSRGRTISKDRAEAVSLYVLQELPLFLDGISVDGRGEIYSVILYPGIGKFDDLVVKILTNECFADLKGRLNILNRTGIANIG